MDPAMQRIFAHVTLEKGLVAAALAMGVGGWLLISAFLQWRGAGFGDLDYSHTMRWVIPGVTLSALGFQTLLSELLLKHFGSAAALVR